MDNERRDNSRRWALFAYVAYVLAAFPWFVMTLAFSLQGGGVDSAVGAALWLAYLWGFFPALIASFVFSARARRDGQMTSAARWTLFPGLWLIPALVLLAAGAVAS